MLIERKSTDRFHELPNYRQELEKNGVTGVITATGGKNGSYFQAYERFNQYQFVIGSRSLYNRWVNIGNPVNRCGTLSIT